MATDRRRILVVVVQTTLAAVGVAFVVVAFVRTLERARGTLLPDAWQLGAALGLVLLSLLAAAPSWTTLLGAPVRKLAHTFYLGQLAKYVPGGVWQPVGQVGLAARAGIPVSRAAAAYPVHAVTQVASGATVGAGLGLWATSLPWAARVAALGGLVSVAFLHRAWMAWVLSVARKVVKRIPDADVLPGQAPILRSYVLGVITVTFNGLAFGLLATSLGVAGVAVAVSAFAVAKTIGFVAIPFPAGVGVREAMLVAALGGPAAPVIAAAVAHRLVIIVGEATLSAASAAARGNDERDAREVKTERRPPHPR